MAQGGLHRGDRRRRRRSAPLRGVHVCEFRKLHLLARVLQERGVRNVRLVTSDALGSLAALHRARQARRARQDRLWGAPDGAPSTS